MATDEELGFVFTELAQAYPNYELPDDSMTIYVREWSKLDGTALLLAAREHIRNSKFYPAISELWTVAKELERKAGKAERDRDVLAQKKKAKQEALPRSEARKMLAALTEAASAGSGTAIVPFRGRGLKRMLSEPAKTYEVGARMTDEEWEQHKRRAKSVDGEPRPVRGKEVSPPKTSAGGRGE